MSSPPPSPAAGSPNGAALWHARWQRFSAAAVRFFHAYATWLVSISWRRFIALAIGLMVLVGILHDLPPFTWRITETYDPPPPRVVVVPQRPAPPHVERGDKADKPNKTTTIGDVQISIGKDGIHITPRAASAASAAEFSASASENGVEIKLPQGVVTDAVREAVAEAQRQIDDSVREAREEARQAASEAEDARRDAEQAIEELTHEQDRATRTRTRTRRVGIGDLMMQFASFWIIASVAIKATYKGRVQAEVKAAQATETAEAESLKRQVVEARMAAMQAQVEPHFLFNTLASIDHLIETDPARASTMQKNLIALLRASMPTMREASGSGTPGGVRDLGRELAVIRPYLEILKVRMEERLNTEILVPDGLLSAEFPPMMIQTLVENAIKHGLEPKAEGGTLRLVAEIMHGKLQVTVADTGLGFGKAATAGTGVGLANIRERLQLLYGPKAALTVAENQPSGTIVTITVPYKSIEGVNA